MLMPERLRSHVYRMSFGRYLATGQKHISSGTASSWPGGTKTVTKSLSRCRSANTSHGGMRLFTGVMRDITQAKTGGRIESLAGDVGGVLG